MGFAIIVNMQGSFWINLLLLRQRGYSWYKICVREESQIYTISLPASQIPEQISQKLKTDS